MNTARVPPLFCFWENQLTPSCGMNIALASCSDWTIAGKPHPLYIAPSFAAPTKLMPWLRTWTPRAQKIFAMNSPRFLPLRYQLLKHSNKSTILLRSRPQNTSALSLLSYSVIPNKRNAVGIICREMSLLGSSKKENRAPCVKNLTSQ